jgi:hypothetical protein
MTSSKKRLLILGMLIILVLAATGLAVAGSNGVIHACVSKAGLLTIVDDATSCKPQETYLQWNIEGIQGPQGPQGPQGSQGPQGPQGPAGVLDFYVVEGTHATCVPGEICHLYAYCNVGDKITGGGLRKASNYAYDDPGIVIAGIYPFFDTTVNKWVYFGAVTNKHVSNEDMWTYAICAEIP